MKFKYLLLSSFIFLKFSAFGQNARPKVILIGIDGLNVIDLQSARTPTFDRLKLSGSWTLNAQSVMPSSSSPNWASMIMGAPPTRHGVYSNSWRNDDYLDSAMYYCESEKEHFPTIFAQLKRNRPDIKTAAFHQWRGWKNIPEDKFLDIRKNVNRLSPRPNIRSGLRYFIKNTPDFMFIHLDHCDHAGHLYGHGSSQYINAVEKADALIGEFIRELESKGLLDETYIIVTSDHGGYLKGHGGPRWEERTIPWFILGPGIKKGYQIQIHVNTYDTAFMIAKLLQVPTHRCWTGKLVEEVFER